LAAVAEPRWPSLARIHRFSAFIIAALVAVSAGCCSRSVGSRFSASQRESIENFKSKNRRTISVSGTAVTRTPPDLILLHLTISDFDTDMLAAKNRNDQKVKAILALRNQLGIQEGDLETGQISIRRVYDQDERGRQGAFRHFLVNRTMLVRQRDFKRFDEFLEKFVASATPEFEIEFQSTRLQEARAQTRLKALQLAKEKAAALANIVGARLGEALTVDEHWPVLSQGGFGGGGFGTTYDLGAQLEPDTSATTLVPGDLEVRVTIYVTFELK